MNITTDDRKLVGSQGMGGSRLQSVDALRGLIIVLMALDHANYFIAQQHSSGEYWGGLFPVYQQFFPFITRFVTHICAPGFFLLMGVGMSLFANDRQMRGWNIWKVRRHFWLRGGLMIVLQFLVVNRAWEQTPSGWGIQVYFGVLYALGIVMILGSFFLRLKQVYLVFSMLILLIGTELLIPDPADWGSRFSVFQYLFLFAGGYPPGLWVNYSALAWLELGIFGLLVGRWLIDDPKAAIQRVFYLGVAFLVVFIILRSLDGFGNIRPRPGGNWMDFFNPVKYPPSITFTLLTTGINLLLFGMLDRIAHWRPHPLHILVVFGATPMFFYVLHLFLYAVMGNWITPKGTKLLPMYLFWLLGLGVLYPLCVWFGRFKSSRPANSMIRFF